VREFGKKSRSEPAVHYIAEIIGQFDLVSLVELRDDLTDLGRVLKILGALVINAERALARSTYNPTALPLPCFYRIYGSRGRHD